MKVVQYCHQSLPVMVSSHDQPSRVMQHDNVSLVQFMSISFRSLKELASHACQAQSIARTDMWLSYPSSWAFFCRSKKRRSFKISPCPAHVVLTTITSSGYFDQFKRKLDRRASNEVVYLSITIISTSGDHVNVQNFAPAFALVT